MKKETFQLRSSDDYIELIALLKVVQIAQTGGHAKHIVEDGAVHVNGEQELRKRKKLIPGDMVEIDDVSIKIIR